MDTTEELLNQIDASSSGAAKQPTTSVISMPTLQTSTDAFVSQIDAASTTQSTINPTNITTPNAAVVTDTNVSEATDDANYNDFSQSDLHNYYRQKFPRLFDEDGNLVDVEAAKAAGILNKTRSISDGDEFIYHYPTSQRPTGPVVPMFDAQYVDQHPTLADTDMLYDSPSNIADNSEQYAYDAAREGKTRSEIVWIDAADTESLINLIAENQELSEEEQEDAKRQVERDILLDVPDDMTLYALNPGKEMAWHISQNQLAFEDIDWNNPSVEVERALADVQHEMRRDKVIDSIIDNMPDGDLKKTLKILGPNGFDALTAVGHRFGWVGAKYGDGIQYLAEQAQAIAPDMYAALDIGTPEEVANDAMYNTAGFLETLDAFIPGVGQTAKLPLTASRASAKAVKAMDKTLDQMSKTTDPKVTARLTQKLTNLNESLSKSVTEELDILAAQDVRKTIDTITKAEKTWNRKLNAAQMRSATDAARQAKREEAASVAANNTDVSEELIDIFENTTGKTIHTVVNGKKVLDPDLARKAGVETAEEVATAQNRTTKDILLGTADIDLTAARVFGQGDEITQPLLKPEKFDALVATIADLKQKYPDAFAPKKWKAGPRKGQDYNVIDHLFELTVNKQLIAGDELIDMLNKYDISFEDYILTVVGSGSEAGKTLQKLSMIKRARPTNEMIAMQEAKTLEAQGAIRRLIMRTENIRRGGLVSQIATASRNLTSAFIRAPLEGLGNVMDTALYNASQQGFGKGAVSLLSPNNWRDSFRHMKYMFSDETGNVKDVVDFILEQPELQKQFDLLFNNINEIQRATGRTDEMIFDFSTIPGNRIDAQTTYKTAQRLIENITDPGLRKAAYERLREANKINLAFGIAEDGVELLNSYNRWQEYLVRRGTFLAELERLTKNEYGIDLVDALKAGKIRDLLNDSSTVRPEGARSFINLVEDATNKALDVTYAKQPNIQVFRSTSSFIVRNGLTVGIPFPRFMFNNLELMGQYAGGASIPLTKKVASVVTRKPIMLNAKDRERISRNLVGMGVTGPVAAVTISSYFEEGEEQPVTDGLLEMASIAAAYQYRTMEDAPADYKLVRGPDGSVVDITPQYPLRQFLWMGEATKRMRDGTFDTWFDSKEFLETFLGTNVRTGVGRSILEDAVNAYAGQDLTSEEAQGKFWGGIAGNYLSSWMVPFAQIIEAERMDGSRGLVMRDASEDPTLDGYATFMNTFTKPFKQRGFGLSPEEEELLPLKEYLFREDASRVSPASKVFLGLSFRTEDEQYGEYLIDLGFTEYELGSKSNVGSIRNFENKLLREFVPTIVEIAQDSEYDLRRQYRANDALKERYTEDEYVTDMLRPLIKGQIDHIKSNLVDDKGLMAKAPEYIVPMLQFRRLGPDGRRAAIAIFVQEYGRQPDGSNPEDLGALAFIGQAYKDVIK